MKNSIGTPFALAILMGLIHLRIKLQSVSMALRHPYVGSFQGFLRVYRPQTKVFRVTDLIFERDLGLPIL
jgi:hypothetical protein